MKLSIVIPVYNEKGTLPEILKRIADVVSPRGIEKEVIIVDDFSSEKVSLSSESAGHPLTVYKIIRHDQNRGKGAAVRTGLAQVTGDFVVIQDADLEYDPADYGRLLEPMLSGAADIVYGTRFKGKDRPAGMSRRNYLANRFLTAFSNLATGMSISDMEVCYKMMKRSVADRVSSRLTSNRFGIEPEITALIKHLRVAEVPISYQGRTAKEGKKIGWKDGIEAMWKIIEFNASPSGYARMARFLFAGAGGAIIDLAILFVCVHWLRIWYIASATIAFVLSYIASFIMQKFWTFRDRSTKRIHVQAASYFVLAIVNLCLNTLLMYFFVSGLGVHYLIAQIVASALIAVESYVVYRRIFRQRVV